MDFGEAKKDLEEKISLFGYKTFRKNKDSFWIKSPSFLKEQIKIEKEIIEEYEIFLKEKEKYHKFMDFGIYNDQICEHKIDNQSYYKNRFFHNRNYQLIQKPLTFKDPKKQNLVKIGECSLTYFFHVINTTNSKFTNFRRFYYLPILENKEKGLHKILKTIITIKFEGYNFTNLKEAESYYKQKILDCFFELSLLKDIHLNLEEEKSSKKNFPRPTLEKSDTKILEIPKLNYKEDLVKHYLLATDNIHPLLAFLSYYQILEGYFVIASNNELVNNLKTELRSPKFDPEINNNLIKVIDLIKTDKYNENEPNQLLIVLRRYISFKRTKTFIEQFEKDSGENHYTGKNKILGEIFSINTEDEKEFYQTLKNRIYSIRCAIVHSKEEFLKRKTKYIPSIKNEECIIKENILMKFLAEETLINAAIKSD